MCLSFSLTPSLFLKPLMFAPTFVNYDTLRSFLSEGKDWNFPQSTKLNQKRGERKTQWERKWDVGFGLGCGTNTLSQGLSTLSPLQHGHIHFDGLSQLHVESHKNAWMHACNCDKDIFLADVKIVPVFYCLPVTLLQIESQGHKAMHIFYSMYAKHFTEMFSVSLHYWCLHTWWGLAVQPAQLCTLRMGPIQIQSQTYIKPAFFREVLCYPLRHTKTHLPKNKSFYILFPISAQYHSFYTTKGCAVIIHLEGSWSDCEGTLDEYFQLSWVM